MGTSFSITIVAPPNAIVLEGLQGEIETELARVETLASTYLPDSELSRFNRAYSSDWQTISGELCTILSEALRISRQTDGAFDLTIGPLVNLWGFGPTEMDQRLPTTAEINTALQDVGYAGLTLDCARPAARKAAPHLLVDLSGWAKGYAVDRLAQLLDDSAIENYLVEIGGEIRTRGHSANAQEFSIGIEAPIAGKATVGATLRITNAAIATSGDYRNFREINGVRYSHTIDPRTGSPIEHQLASVTVVSDTAARADAMATALLVLGPDAGMTFANDNEIAAYFIAVTSAGTRSSQSRMFTSMRTTQ